MRFTAPMARAARICYPILRMLHGPRRRIASQLGRWAIAYLDHVPSHRGQWRLVRELGRVLGPVPLRAAGGAELLVRLDSAMDRSYVSRGKLDHPELMAAIAALGRGDVVVDVGANAGLYSVLAARAVAPGGRVYAFEPSRDEFARLAWAISANGLDNVIAANVALADRRGAVGFVSGPSDHTGLHRLEAAGEAPTTSVWAERGDRAIPLADGENVALLKIDVEGAELSVLRGFDEWLAARRIECLVVEVTDQFLQRFGASARELYAYLAAYGYVPKRGPLDVWQYDEVFVPRPAML